MTAVNVKVLTRLQPQVQIILLKLRKRIFAVKVCLCGSSILFEVEEEIEDDQDDDFPEQGMVTLIQNDQSDMMNAAIKEMIHRAVKRGPRW